MSLKNIALFIVAVFIRFVCYAQITPGGPVSLCQGNNQVLTAPAGSNYQWQKDNADIGGATLQTNTVNTNGNYRVIYKTSGGTVDTSAAVAVTVNPNPVADFTIASYLCAELPVQFTNISTGSGLTYSWDFGDVNSSSNSSTVDNPTHIFIGNHGNGTQNFVVTLTVTNNFGCKISKSKTIVLKQAPDASLGGTGATTYLNQQYFTQCSNTASDFTFTNLSTTNNSDTSYRIIWGDAAADYSANSFTSIVHNYNIGSYPLTYIVKGNNGCTTTSNYKVFIGSNPGGSISSPSSTIGCTGDTISFPYANIESNPLGTQYIIMVDDESPTEVFNHPPPAYFTHVFNKPSCPKASGNAFTVNYLITNPCSYTPGTIGGIRISTRPKAEFKISPNDTACVNTDVSFIDDSPMVYNVDANGVCADGKYIWKIFPTTGFTIVQGSKGNDFNSNDPSLWMGGSKTLILNFSVPGTYMVTFKLGGNVKCGNDQIVKTICIDPTPDATFTTNGIIGCAPFIVNTQTTTNTSTCGVNSFKWNLLYTPTVGCSPSTSDAVYVNNTDTSSKEPVFQFNNPGSYSIGLTVYSPAKSCSTIVNNSVITVKGKPVINSVDFLKTICEGESISPVLLSGCYVNESSYKWTFDHGLPGSSTTNNPGTIIYNTTGSFPVSVTVINSCDSSTLSQQVTVNPIPDVTAAADTVFCAGEATGPFSFTGSPGSTITWTNDNTAIGLAAGGSGNISSFTTAGVTASTTANITVTATTGACSKQAVFHITVHQKPALPTASSPVNYCIGDAPVPLMASGNAGNSILWYDAGGTSTSTAPVPSTSAAGTTSYYVSQLDTLTGCESDRSPVVVNVNAVPAIISNSATNPTTCGTPTGSIVLDGLTPNTSYTVNYTKTGAPVSVTLTSGSTGSIIISALSAADYADIRVALNGCTSNSTGPLSLHDPVIPPSPVADSVAPLCSTKDLRLSASTTLQGAVTYSWSGPGGFSSTQQNPVITNVPVSAAGPYYVTIQQNNCTSLPDSVIVVVNATPGLPVITTNSPVCSGNDIKLQTPPGAGLTYLWSGPNGFTSTIPEPVINGAGVTNSGTYQLTVTATAGNCSSPTASSIIEINPTPVISGFSSVNPSNCGSPTGSIALNGLTPGVTYMVSYNNGTDTALTADAAGSVTINGLVSGTYTNISAALNGCPSNSIASVVLTDPNPPPSPVASGESPLCTGDTIRLSATTAITQPVIYSWIGPGGYTSSLSTPVIFPADVLQSGKYYVTVTLNNCRSLADTVYIVINARPADPVISSNSPVCRDDSLKLSAAIATPGIVSYTWAGPNGFGSNEQSPVIANVSSAAAGIYIVTAQQLNCFSVHDATTNVTIRPKPDVASVTVNNPTSCGTYTGSIVLEGFAPSTPYGLSYTWNNTAPAYIATTTNPAGAVVIRDLPAGTYTGITVSDNGCSSNPVGPLTLVNVPATTPTITGDSALCSGDTLRLSSALAVSGTVTYAWVGPNGFTSSVQNPVIPNVQPAGSGPYTVTTTLNGCLSSNKVDVVVSPPSVGGFSGVDSTVCLGTNTGVINTAGYTGSIVRWEASVDGSTTWNTIINNTPTLVYTNLTDTTLYRAVVASGVCPVAYSGVTRIAVVSKVDDADAGPDQKLCNQAIANLIANNPAVGKGLWTQVAGPAVLISNPDNATTAITGLQSSQTYRFRWTITGSAGCGSSADEIEIINRPAVTVANAGPGTDMCNFTNTRSITLGANIDATRSYENGQWTILSQPLPASAVLSNTSIPNPVFTFSNPGIYRLQWSIGNDVPSGCASSKDTIVFNVSNPPTANFSVSSAQFCSNIPVAVANSSANAHSYQWFWGDGDTSSFVSGQHAYVNAGVYTIKLVAKNTTGAAVCLDSAVTQIAAIQKIVAQINVAPGTTCLPYTLQASAANATAATFVKWIIYDGSLSPGVTYANGASAAHTYNFAGNDSIRLIVNNTFGCADTATYRFKVYAIPVTTIDPTDLTTCSHDSTIVFQSNTANPGNDTISYRWFINNQLSGNTTPFSYRLLTPPGNTTPVSYTVQLLAQNAGQCGDTSLPATVSVLPLPMASIKVSPGIVLQQPDYTFTFEDTSAAAPAKFYLWTMGDRSMQTRSENPVMYKYGDTGTYHVRLLVTDQTTGCQNGDSAQVRIEYIPGYLHVPNAICPGCTNNEVKQFLPLGKGLSYYRLRIYTTWGQKLFETTALNPDGSPKEAWNAKVDQFNNGSKTLQQDVYRWEIEARFTNNTEWRGMLYPNSSKLIKSGFLTIIK